MPQSERSAGINPALRALRRFGDWIWIILGGKRHVFGPSDLGLGLHDCGPASLYRVVPWIPESRIREAFQYCSESWPYSGVSNRDFQIVVKYLRLRASYSDIKETVGSLLSKSPERCVALIPGHYIGIIDGEVLPPDTNVSRNAMVHFHWTFPTPTWSRRVVDICQTAGNNT